MGIPEAVFEPALFRRVWRWLVLWCALVAASPAVAATVCAPGHPDGPCTFPTLSACAAAVPTGGVCEALSGVYVESVSRTTASNDVQLVCAPGHLCVLDGEGVLATAASSNGTWSLRGFEVRHYLGPALLDLRDISDCDVHDVFGDAVFRARGVVERCRIQRIVGRAFVGTGTFSPVTVRRCLITDASGVQTTASLEHNTLVRIAGSTTGPTITATNLRYNVIYNDRDRTVSANGVSWYNVFGGSALPRATTFSAVQLGDVDADPSFLGYEDFRLAPGSPGVDLAASSSSTVDLDGDPVVGVPDAGAFELDPLDTDATAVWTTREVLGTPTFRAPRPQLAFVPGQGPVVALFDVAAGGMVFAQRRVDGTWQSEVFADADIVDTNPNLNALDLAVGPDGFPAVAYLHDGLHLGAPGSHVYLAVRNGCSGGCGLDGWQGCGADLVASFPDDVDSEVGVKLAFDPLTGEPIVATRIDERDGCGPGVGYSHIDVHRKVDGAWTSVVAVDGDCLVPERFSRDFELVVDELGVVEVIYAVATVSGTFAPAELRIATDDGAGFGSAAIPFVPPLQGHVQFQPVAAALAADGTLGVYWSTVDGFAFVERDPAGAWGVDTVVMPPLDTSAQAARAAHLVYDSVGDPVLVSGSKLSASLHVFVDAYLDGFVSHRMLDRADREASDLSLMPIEIALFGADARALTLQRNTGSGGTGFDVEFFADADPGGLALDAGSPVCDACPDDPAKTGPGVCGCGVPDDDADSDGIVDCIDDAPVAVDDAVTLDEDALDAVLAVLDNDDLGADGPGGLTVVSDGTHGAAFVDDQGTEDADDDVLLYTPFADYASPDALTYEVCDADGDCALATVTLTVVQVPDAPVATPDAIGVLGGTSVEIDVAANDLDVDGDLDPSTVNTACGTCAEPVHGTLVANGDGTFTYAIGVTHQGPDDFVYEICDAGGLCATAEVQVTVDLPPVQIGVYESVAVADGAAVVAPIQVGVVEVVGVRDTAALRGPVRLSVGEPVAVADGAAVAAPAHVRIAEVVGVADAAGVLGPAAVSVAEAVAVADTVTGSAPARIVVAEVVGVADAHGVIGPATVAVAERVDVGDAAVVRGPVVVGLTEAIAVGDAAAVASSDVTVSVVERVAVTEATPVATPVRVQVHEAVTVHDRARVTRRGTVCSTVPRAAAPWLPMLVGLLAVRRRRHSPGEPS